MYTHSEPYRHPHRHKENLLELRPQYQWTRTFHELAILAVAARWEEEAVEAVRVGVEVEDGVVLVFLQLLFLRFSQILA